MRQETHDAYEHTWKCGELEIFFSPIRRRKKKKKKKETPRVGVTRLVDGNV